MKEKKFINSLLQSKFSWWNRLWNKGKSKDSPYQETLVSLREGVVNKNSKEDSKLQETSDFQVYLDMVKDYLEIRGQCLLTEEQEKIVVDHLKVVAATFCSKCNVKRNDAVRIDINDEQRNDIYDGLGIVQVLSIETAKKVSEIHPDMTAPTDSQLGQRVKEVLAVQNYLESNPG